MGILRKLAGQTMVYGLGTIVPRLLNYLLLTPFYTRVFMQGEYGVVTELYAYSAFLLALLTYGMETTFFRFSEKSDNPSKVYTTSFLAVFFPSLLFIALMSIFNSGVAYTIDYSSHAYYIVLVAVIIGLEAISSIPFANLRRENKAGRFALIKFINILINIGINLYFLVLCPYLSKISPDSILIVFYSPSIGVGYAFIANLAASAITLLLLMPSFRGVHWIFDKQMFREMLNYSLPILIISLAGMFNQVADKLMLKYLIAVPAEVTDPKEYVMAQLGIYGANYKLAVLMTIFTSMFKYAAEPFFFAHEKEENSRNNYAEIMKYFIIFGLIIFLGVVLYIDITKYFIGIDFRSGLDIVPLVLLAQLFLGIFYNLSIWYKLTDKTRLGAYIALVGSAITLILNIVLVPVFGYMGAAIAGFFCYLAMMIVSYFWGKKYFVVPYDIPSILFYFGIATLIYLADKYIQFDNSMLNYALNTLLMIAFLAIVVFKEKIYLRFVRH